MKTIKEPIQSEISVKKSQFICSLFPTRTKAESKQIIQKINKQYADATHNCTAYIVSDGEGFDDDGEPGGTAGKPMINVLRKNEIHNVTAIVTRYFGGIKLGAGGLVRAYSKSVMDAIGNAEILEIEEYEVYQITFEYSDIKIADTEVRNNNLEVIDKQYSDKVSYDIVSKDNRDILKISNFLKKNKSLKKLTVLQSLLQVLRRQGKCNLLVIRLLLKQIHILCIHMPY